jgi:hypothetical protein
MPDALIFVAMIGFMVMVAAAILVLLVAALRRAMRGTRDETAKALWVLIVLLTFPIGAIAALVMLTDDQQTFGAD